MFEKFTTKEGQPVTVNVKQVLFIFEQDGATIIGMPGNVNVALRDSYLDVTGRLIGAMSGCGGCR